MLARAIRFFGDETILACDGNCSKAWGINHRPREQLSGDEDDVVYLADDELDEAPVDPGTYEGNEMAGKPQCLADRLNKWCCRECERSVKVAPGMDFQLPSYKYRVFNMPWLHQGEV